MRIRGGMGSGPALATPRDPARDRLARVVRKPAIGVAVITPLMLAAAVAASGPSPSKPVRSDRATPLAVVAPTAQDMTGPTVVAAAKPPAGLHIATATVSAPPPAAVVSAPGALGIPAIALSAYRSAEGIMARTNPSCGVSWNLLAGIGRIESGHANNGATDTRGTSLSPIYGPSLDGSLPGNEIIVASSQLGRVTYARAMGPMQFLPGTWSRYASDGDGDGKADPQNVYDSSLAAARYLCGGGLNLRDPVTGDDRDPALQQLRGVRAQCPRLGRWLHDRRCPCQPATDHRTGSGDRRHTSGCQRTRPRPRPTGQRPTGSHAGVRPRPERCCQSVAGAPGTGRHGHACQPAQRALQHLLHRRGNAPPCPPRGHNRRRGRAPPRGRLQHPSSPYRPVRHPDPSSRHPRHSLRQRPRPPKSSRRPHRRHPCSAHRLRPRPENPWRRSRLDRCPLRSPEATSSRGPTKPGSSYA